MPEDDVLAVLADFAGPLGPLQTPEEHKARRQHWMDTVTMSAVDRLLAVLLRSPTPPELARRLGWRVLSARSVGHAHAT